VPDHLHFHHRFFLLAFLLLFLVHLTLNRIFYSKHIYVNSITFVTFVDVGSMVSMPHHFLCIWNHILDFEVPSSLIRVLDNKPKFLSSVRELFLSNSYITLIWCVIFYIELWNKACFQTRYCRE